MVILPVSSSKKGLNEDEIGAGRLFPDAKVFENVSKYLIIRHFANDAAEVVEALAEVLGDQVGGEGGAKAVADAVEGGGGALEGFQMTGVGYQRGLGGGVEILPGHRQGIAQFLQAGT